MGIIRESEPASQPSEESSAVRPAPLEDDDAHELQPHEFTLEPEDAGDAADAAGAFDDVTAPWATLPPLPAWASTARALLEPPTLPDTRGHVTFVDDDPTPAVEAIACSVTELRALRAELAEATSDTSQRVRHIETLERSLAEANVALGELDQRRNEENAVHEGRIRGQAFRIAELEADLHRLSESLAATEQALREQRAAAAAAPPLTPPDRAWVFAAEDDEAFVREAAAFERVAEVAEEASAPEIHALVLDDEGNEIAADIDVDTTMELTPHELDDATQATDGEAELEVAETPSTIRQLAPLIAVRGDDLTQIRGIGPRYAKRLSELGIRSYARIASWKAADVARVAEQLGVGVKRIQREAWVKQARKLLSRAHAARAARGPVRRARKRA